MISVSVNGADKVAARMARTAREMPTALEKAVARASVMVHGELKQQMSGTGSTDPFLGRKGASPPQLGVRTGGTRARLSPGGKVFRLGNQITSAVGSPDRHVKAHEDGATIMGSPYLRIPLAAAQTASGQDRNVGRSVRGLPDLFVMKSKRGNLFLARGAGRALELLYLLVRSVHLPARHMFKTVTERTRPRVEATLGGQVAVEVNRANRG